MKIMKKILTAAVWMILQIPAAAGIACAGETDAGTDEKPLPDAGAVSVMKIAIQITGGSETNTIHATLENNTSAAAFYGLLQKGELTIDMHDYGNFEKVGTLPASLPRNDTQITTSPGDIILYQGNQITIYYDVNSWKFTRLGKVDGLTQDELRKILGEGNVTAVFSVMEQQIVKQQI